MYMTSMNIGTHNMQSVKAVLGKEDVAVFFKEKFATMHRIQEMN